MHNAEKNKWYELELCGPSVKIHFGSCAKGKGSCHPKMLLDGDDARAYAQTKVKAQGKKGFQVVEASTRPAK